MDVSSQVGLVTVATVMYGLSVSIHLLLHCKQAFTLRRMTMTAAILVTWQREGPPTYLQTFRGRHVAAVSMKYLCTRMRKIQNTFICSHSDASLLKWMHSAHGNKVCTIWKCTNRSTQSETQLMLAGSTIKRNVPNMRRRPLDCLSSLWK